jgi:hypothetical protein
MVRIAFISSFSFAEIKSIVIEKREPFAGGDEFPVTGPYEKLIGKASGDSRRALQRQAQRFIGQRWQSAAEPCKWKELPAAGS